MMRQPVDLDALFNRGIFGHKPNENLQLETSCSLLVVAQAPQL